MNTEELKYKKVAREDAVKRARRGESSIEHSPIWQLLKKDIDKGDFAKKDELLQLGPYTKKELIEHFGVGNRRTIARYIQKYVLSIAKPYTVYGFTREEGTYLQVKRDERYEKVKTQTRRKSA
jgi:hypothetical protein